MSTKYILALDQGTTSSRAILFDQDQNIVEMTQREFTQIYPRRGWVEHDLMEIWSSQYGVMMEVVARSGVDARDIAAIGITNQRETTIVWDKETGRPIYNAIVWQCRRTAPIIDELLEKGCGETIRKRPGLCRTPTFRQQDQMDFGPGARQPRAGRKGRAFVRQRWTPGWCGS